MRWKAITEEQKMNARIERFCYWHKFFAWYPIYIIDERDGVRTRHWMETVGRKMKAYHSYNEWGGSDRVGMPVYCEEIDLVSKCLCDNELMDERESNYRHPMRPPPPPQPPAKRKVGSA